MIGSEKCFHLLLPQAQSHHDPKALRLIRYLPISSRLLFLLISLQSPCPGSIFPHLIIITGWIPHHHQNIHPLYFPKVLSFVSDIIFEGLCYYSIPVIIDLNNIGSSIQIKQQMMQNIPSLDLTLSQHSSCSTSRSRLGRSRREGGDDSEVEIWEGDTRLVNLQYFRKKQMFCTVSRQKQSIQVYANKNSVLLAIWIDLLKKQFRGSISVIEQDLLNQQLSLEMSFGVPPQLNRLNNNKTIKEFMLCVLKQIADSKLVSGHSLENTILQMLIDYPFFVFCGVSYVRNKGLIHLQKNFNKYQFDLIGNEETCLRDYSVELRNMTLEIVADALDRQIELVCNSSVQRFGNGKQLLKIEKNGNSYLLHLNTEFWNEKAQKGSDLYVSTVTSSSHQFEQLPANKICNRCLSVKTGKFCECRKKKVVNIHASQKPKEPKIHTKKYCDKCESNFTFVCKCYLDQ